MIAVDQVGGKRRTIGRGDDRLQVVLLQQEVNAFRGAEYPIGGNGLVVRGSQRCGGVRIRDVEGLRQLEDLLREERHLLGSVGVVEVDRILECAAGQRDADSSGEVLL